jgi:anaphase-promoting complex subunit 8
VGEAEAEEPEEELDNVLLAKAYFDSNEFLRAAHTLRAARGARARFLRWYSLFLAGEKRKDERMLEEGSSGSAAVPTGRPRAVNEQLVLLHARAEADLRAPFRSFSVGWGGKFVVVSVKQTHLRER